MNEIQIEALLIGAFETDNNIAATFVTNTMRRIHALPSSMPPKRSKLALLRFSRPQFAFGIIAVVIAASLIGFSGYAYAIGSDPITLIKRIIEGDKVKIGYKDRQFEHGVAQTYSDAAVTAYAELNTVEGLAFAASNVGAIPKDGVEYLSAPYGYDAPHIYPTLGTITAVTDHTLTIQQLYTLGDKTNASHDMVSTITIPRSTDLQFFKDAKQADITAGDVGRLVQFRQSPAVKHRLGASEKPSIVTRYLVFALQHSLAEFKEADKATTNPGTTKQLSTSGLVEKNFGKLDDRCLNNGADFCDPALLSNNGQSLYGKGVENTNRQVVPFGESIEPGRAQPDLLLRNIYGTLKEVTPETITIQGSSGSRWTLKFTLTQRERFKSIWGTELRQGDMIGGSILQNMNELDNRTVANDHMYNLLRIESTL